MESRMGVESSNPTCSTLQSLRFRTLRRIARESRVYAGFAIESGPGERLLSPRSGGIGRFLSGRGLGRSVRNGRNGQLSSAQRRDAGLTCFISTRVMQNR